MYIYTSNKLKSTKHKYNSAQFYEIILEDGDTKEEDDEPLPSRSKGEMELDFMQVDKNCRDEKNASTIIHGLQ